MLEKFIKKLDSLKASDPNCISVVVLKNCEPELSYMLTVLCNVSEKVLFSRWLEDLISGPCI